MATYQTPAAGYRTPAITPTITPQNQYMTPVQPIVPVTQPQYQTQSSAYPVASGANGGTVYSNGQTGVLAPAPLPNTPVNQPNSGVIGVNTFNPVYGSNATPGGSYSSQYIVGPSAEQRQMAVDRQALVDQQKSQGITMADQSYNDMTSNLSNQENQIRTGYTNDQSYINQLTGSNKTDLAQQSDLAKRSARQSYQDAILNARVRARALGGATSSGYLDLTSRLDQALAGNITGIDTANMTSVNKANLVATKALTDLQAELDKNLNEIANAKNTSLRERDKQKFDIENQAAQAALEIKSWLDGKTQTLTSTVKVAGTPNTIPSIAEQTQAYRSQVLGQFSNELGSNNGVPITTNDPRYQTTLQKYAPAFQSAGINANDISGYYTAPKETAPSYADNQATQSVYNNADAIFKSVLDTTNDYAQAKNAYDNYLKSIGG